MNFNFNNQRKLHFAPPIMRHFSTLGLVPAKVDQNDCLLKSDNILKSVQNNFFSSFQANVLPTKSFSNPNFVNKQNPNILCTSTVAGVFNKLSNENLKSNLYTQQPKHDNYVKKHTDENPKVYQPLPEKLSSQNWHQSIVHTPEMPPSIELTTDLTPAPTKKIRNRNRKNKKNSKRQKQESITLEPSTDQKSNMTIKKCNKINCSSPKKFKKSQETKQKSKKSKKSKPWHKISFDQEIMECDEPILMSPESTEIFENSPKEGFCVQIKSPPIEISPKCNGIISEALSFSISPCTEFLKTLSTSNSSNEIMSCSPSSPAIRRLRMPSECDSEDSFIVFCNDTNEALSEEISSEESETEDESDSESDFDVPDFREKTDINKSPAKKKVSFACDNSLCTVHPMVQWGYAYHAARRGPWEQLARDRARFETRISNAGQVINNVLDPEHRQKIFRDRFQDL